MALPKEVFVRQDLDPNDMTIIYLAAYDTAEEAIEDDGPTVIGTYRLVSTQRFEKVARVIEPPKKRRAK